MNKLKNVGLLFVDAFKKWQDDRAVRMAAALAYYGIFSLAPILIIVTGIVGSLVERFFGELVQAVNLNSILRGIFGPDVTELILQLVENTDIGNSITSSLPLASVISVGIVLWGASSIFKYLHEALNTIWGIEPIIKGGILATIRRYAVSFVVVFLLGFIMVIYLVLITAVSFLLPALNRVIPNALGILPDFRLLQVAQFVILFIIGTLLFSTFFKILPDVEIKWRDVFVGAAFTAFLFGIGVIVLSIYFSFYSSSLYGAAGSLVVLLLWSYYSAQIFLYGAEFTYIYATRYGSQIQPAEYVGAVEEDDGEKVGLESGSPEMG
ncbi:MAG: YihY/virulence factor BrkB family protein [Chloroflexota bacterium]|jgi:membrane protein